MRPKSKYEKGEYFVIRETSCAHHAPVWPICDTAILSWSMGGGGGGQKMFRAQANANMSEAERYNGAPLLVQFPNR